MESLNELRKQVELGNLEIASMGSDNNHQKMYKAISKQTLFGTRKKSGFYESSKSTFTRAAKTVLVGEI